MCKFYHTMLSLTIDAMRSFPGDQKFKFYYALALSLEERATESNREAEILQKNDEFSIFSLLMQMNNLKNSSISNKDQIVKLKTEIRTIRKTANDQSLYYAGLYLFIIQKYDKSKEYIDRALKLSKTQNSDYYLIKGWLELQTSKDESGYNVAWKYFEISSKSNDPECLIAKAIVLTRMKSYQKALNILDELIATYSNLIPCYIEKIKINVEINNWEQVLELSTKTLTIDRHSIDALCYVILYYLIWNFNEQQTCNKLMDLGTSIEIREPKNARIYYELSKLFSQLACDNREIVSVTFTLIEKAVIIDNKATYLCQLGMQSLKLDQFVDAERYLKNAYKLDSGNMNTLYGLLVIALKKNDEEFIKQIETLESNYDRNQMPMLLLYMCALIKKHQKAPFKEINFYLSKIIECHLEKIKKISPGIKFYLELNVELILKVVKIYLEYGPVEAIIANENEKNPIVIGAHFMKEAERYLKPVMLSCPALMEPIYLMAKIKYLTGDFTNSLQLLNRYIEKSSNFSDALFLKAKILTIVNKTNLASQSLESALSHNFQIRDEVDFTILRAQILKQENKFSDSLKLLEDLKKNISNGSRHKKITDYDRITLDLMLSELYLKIGRKEDSNEHIENLIIRYKNTVHEKRILIANSTIQESLGNIDDAILILKRIQFTNKSKLGTIKDTNEYNNELEFYIKSKERLANIYLKYQNDLKLFIKCYEDILEIDPSIESHLMLGNSYLIALEPEKSIEIYEKALKKNPKDASLMRKVGQLYVQIHLYEKAITYYKAAIKTSGNNHLKFDLANLLHDIKRNNEAIEIINNAKLQLRNGSNNLEILEFEAKINHLLAGIQFECDNKEQGIFSLQAANDAQTKVMRRLLSENPDSFVSNSKFAIKICTELADQTLIYHHNTSKSILYLKEALNYDSNNIEVLIKLARLELSLNNVEKVDNYCKKILKISIDNQDALLILAEIMFRRNQFDNSLELFQQILEKKPDNTLALSQLIEVARRCGLLIDLIPTYIEKAEKITDKNTSFNQITKFSYCKGLYYYFMGSIEKAIRLFINSKNDDQFGLQSLHKIINILVNPENDIIGSESFHNIIEASDDETLYTREVSIKVAEKFLSEIEKNYGNTIDFHLTKSILIFATKQKNEIENAMSTLVRLSNEKSGNDNVKLNFGVATGHMVMKQLSKAKAILKRLIKFNWTYSDAEYFEKIWLLLSDIYIQTNKCDAAIDHLKMCILYNKSCIKAYELLGQINEKDQEYHEASEYYQKAWTISNMQNGRIGYKLAVCYMKSGKFIEAIDICEILLTILPQSEIKGIKKEIMERWKLYVI